MAKNLASESMAHVDQTTSGGHNKLALGSDGVSSPFVMAFVDFPHLLTYNSATTFHIENHVVLIDGTISSFCIEASSLNGTSDLYMKHGNGDLHMKHGKAEDLYMKPCDENEILQMWFMDIFGQLRPKDNDSVCVRWEKKDKLILSPNCKSDFYSAFFDSKIYKFNFEQKINAIYADKPSGKKYVGVKEYDQYSKVRLYDQYNMNHSLNQWTLKWVIYESQEPSAEPSLTPTFSQSPSLLPTTSPSAKPSPSPSLSQIPSMQPSLFPSDKPSLQPSTFPSDKPSLLPSDEVCCSHLLN